MHNTHGVITTHCQNRNTPNGKMPHDALTARRISADGVFGSCPQHLLRQHNTKLQGHCFL